MLRGPLSDTGYRPRFTGHETFPLRYGWLKKAYDAVYKVQGAADAKFVFSADDAIARFGVGRNMVSSIRHWALACHIISDGKDGLNTGSFGDLIFREDGLDPHMEHPTTLWLLHWLLVGRPQKTTYYWAFNHFHGQIFERDQLVKGLLEIAREKEWARVAETTVKRDVDCFVRTYVAKAASGKQFYEDALESPLAELGLIRILGRRDGYRFVRGPKPTLGDNVFLFALVDFWKGHSDAATISYETLAHEPGSPGRVFLLDEEDLLPRLQNLDEISAGAMRWSETAGLKQVIREGDVAVEDVLASIGGDYPVREAA